MPEKNIELLNAQILEHSPKVVVVANKEDVLKVNHNNVYFGEKSILKVIGLRPTLSALSSGKK